MDFKDYKVITYGGRISKEVINILIEDQCDDDEQTSIIYNKVYEVNVDADSNILYIRKYTYEQYSAKYGQNTLYDLLECYGIEY